MECVENSPLLDMVKGKCQGPLALVGSGTVCEACSEMYFELVEAKDPRALALEEKLDKNFMKRLVGKK